MHDFKEVSLVPAGSGDAVLLCNLLELYIHDLSAIFPDVKLGQDGRFGYPKLPLYLTQDERRFAFLIRCGAEVAGFVLATRGSPVSADPNTFDVAEFFVIRRHRRSGVGKQAAFLLWQRLAGKWTVRVSQRNTGALGFWRSTIANFSSGTGVEFEHPEAQKSWRVLAFESGPGHAHPA